MYRAAFNRELLTGVVALAALAWAGGVQAAMPAQAEAGHEFRFDGRAIDPKPKAVFLAGSFNGWNPIAEAMVDDGAGVFTLRRDLPDGVHLYKFVVDGNWTNDPGSDHDLEEQDGHGGTNSAVLIGEDARKLPPAEPGAVRLEAIRFDPSKLSDFNVVKDDLLRLSLRAQTGDVDAANVWVAAGEKGTLQKFPLWRGESAMGFERWSGVAGIPGKPMRYVFELVDGGKSFFLHASGGGKAAGRLFPTPQPELGFATDARVTFATPEWAKHAVWYQIFPERFRNGDKANDPGDKNYERLTAWTAEWFKTQPGEVSGDENFYQGAGNVWQRRYGGDVQGIREKLPYLRSLGVTALYLNPVFEASSMHKYDARDFRHIDDNFTVRNTPTAKGEKSEDPATWEFTEGDRVFLDFIAEAKRQGFRVVLDGVFNHVGRDHPYFRDVMEKGAASTYAGWFDIDKFADVSPTTEDLFGKPGGMVFKAWDGINGHLPKFKHDPVKGLAAGPYEHMMNITRRWMAPGGDVSRGIDGWRLDVANEVPSAFWRDWRKVVKGINPEAYISGEIWSPAQHWLEGDQFDGVMNYQFAMAGQRFFVNQERASTPTQFARELDRLVGLYPLQAGQVVMNLYDSHDTDRLASMFVNPDRPYDGQNRIQDNGPDYSSAQPDPTQWSRLKQAIAFQMTFVGAPMLYYGTEAGMWSPDDPSNRMPMVWQDLEPYAGAGVEFNEDVFRSTRRSIAVRRTLPALVDGYFRVLYANDGEGVVAFLREIAGGAPGSSAVVIVNRSGVERTVGVPVPMENGTRVVNWMNPDGVELVLPGDAADARPTLRVRPDAMRHIVTGGKVGLTLQPWSVAVLAGEGAAASGK